MVRRSPLLPPRHQRRKDSIILNRGAPERGRALVYAWTLRLQLIRFVRLYGSSNVSKTHSILVFTAAAALAELKLSSPHASSALEPQPAITSCSSLTGALARARATLRPQRDALDAKQTRADALHTKSSQ